MTRETKYFYPFTDTGGEMCKYLYNRSGRDTKNAIFLIGNFRPKLLRFIQIYWVWVYLSIVVEIPHFCKMFFFFWSVRDIEKTRPRYCWILRAIFLFSKKVYCIHLKIFPLISVIAITKNIKKYDSLAHIFGQVGTCLQGTYS